MLRHLSFAGIACSGATAWEGDADPVVVDVQVEPDGIAAGDVPAGRVLAIDGDGYLSKAGDLVDCEAGSVASPRGCAGRGLDGEDALSHVGLGSADTHARVVDTEQSR